MFSLWFSTRSYVTFVWIVIYTKNIQNPQKASSKNLVWICVASRCSSRVRYSWIDLRSSRRDLWESYTWVLTSRLYIYLFFIWMNFKQFEVKIFRDVQAHICFKTNSYLDTLIDRITSRLFISTNDYIRSLRQRFLNLQTALLQTNFATKLLPNSQRLFSKRAEEYFNKKKLLDCQLKQKSNET